MTKCIGKEKDKKEAEEKGKIQETGKLPNYINKVHFEQFAGSATCAACHKDIYKKHVKTGHYLTSQPALEKYIRGSFKKGENTFAYSPFTHVSMEKSRPCTNDPVHFQIL